MKDVSEVILVGLPDPHAPLVSQAVKDLFGNEEPRTD